MKRLVTSLAATALLIFSHSAATAAESAPPTSAAAAKKAASPDSPELAAFKKAIRAKYDLKEKAFANHDAETILTKFYTPDVISVEGTPDGGIYVGREQIRPLYERVVKDSLVKVDSVHTFVNGDSGWDWADFHVTFPDGKVKPFTFAILFLWTKVNGEWMCKGDYFVTGSFREGKLAKAPAGP
jgi:uncharacterized protein DUF4440